MFELFRRERRWPEEHLRRRLGAPQTKRYDPPAGITRPAASNPRSGEAGRTTGDSGEGSRNPGCA
jgi:hypothetical protein